MSVGSAPDPNLVSPTVSLASLEPSIFALLLTSSSTMEPSTMFAELTCMPLGKVPVAILV